MSATVVVLNANYLPHQVVDMRHALRMLCRQVAVVEEAEEGRTIGPFPVPKVVRLLKFVYLKFNPSRGGPRYSRAAILRRDNNTCTYCGKHGNTIDHIIPRSQGGLSSWMNSVTACRRCNEKKANRTPAEAGMPLLFKPYVPSFFDFTQ